MRLWRPRDSSHKNISWIQDTSMQKFWQAPSGNCRKSRDLLGLLGVSQPEPGPEGLVSYPSLDIARVCSLLKLGVLSDPRLEAAQRASQSMADRSLCQAHDSLKPGLSVVPVRVKIFKEGLGYVLSRIVFHGSHTRPVASWHITWMLVAPAGTTTE